MPFVSTNVGSVEYRLHCSRGDLLPLLSAAWWSKVGESSVLIYLWTCHLIPQKMNKETVFSVLFIVNMNCDMQVTQTECSLFLLVTSLLSNASSYLPSAQAMAASTKIMHIWRFLLIHHLYQPVTHNFTLNALNVQGVHFAKSHLVLDLNTLYLNSLYKYLLNPFYSGAYEQIGALVHFMPLRLTSVTLTVKNPVKKKRGGNQTRQTPSYIYLSFGFFFDPLGFLMYVS